MPVVCHNRAKMGLLLLSRARMRDTLLWLRSAIDYGVQEQQQPDDATASSDASSATTVDPAEWSRVLREAGSAGRHAMRPCRKILWIAKGEETGGEDSSDGES